MSLKKKMSCWQLGPRNAECCWAASASFARKELFPLLSKDVDQQMSEPEDSTPAGVPSPRLQTFSKTPVLCQHRVRSILLHTSSPESRGSSDKATELLNTPCAQDLKNLQSAAAADTTLALLQDPANEFQKILLHQYYYYSQ